MKLVAECSKAVAEAVRMSRPAVIAAYPITPQTHIVERLAEMVADGEFNCEFITVESEFAALSVVQGASARGVRTYSATSSQGLALMHEVLHATSGLRLPIVMNVANRALSAPINIWNDHSDSMAARDTGWLQLHSENPQEALDLTLQAFRIAEDPKVSLPAMVCLDGFILTHVLEPVDLPTQDQVDKLIPKFKPNVILDPDNPVTIGPIAYPDTYMDFKADQDEAMRYSEKIIDETQKKFEKIFGRKYSRVETYNLDKSDTAVMAMGSLVGTLKEFSDENNVGVIKVGAFRPFPTDLLRKCTKDLSKIIVLDKALSFGSFPPLFGEVSAALYGSGIKLQSSICGLGGRDVTFDHIKQALEGKEWLF
jgi:pyruvate ferredoxin oxidoreductase alpha subunit